MTEKLKAIHAMLLGMLAQVPSGMKTREDAAYDTMFLARELTQIEAEQYRVLYPDIKFRSILPVRSSGLDPAASFIVYKVWDYFGLAKFISHYADDLPKVGLRAKEVASKVESIGNSYGWSILEMMRASLAGVALEREEAQAAFEFIERKHQELAVRGAPEVGLGGFATNSEVAVSSPAANGGENGGGGTSTNFIHKTPLEIVADLNALVFEARDAARQIGALTPNKMVMPETLYGLVSTMPMSDQNPTTTVLSVFVANNPYVKTVVPWNELETAGDDGGPRIVLFNDSRRHGEYLEPLPARAEAPQDRNLAVVVNVWSRSGGYVIRQPLAYLYVDGAGPVPS